MPLGRGAGRRLEYLKGADRRHAWGDHGCRLSGDFGYSSIRRRFLCSGCSGMFLDLFLINSSYTVFPQAYQRLCEWRHGVGSAAIALFTSFFASKANDAIEQTAEELLDKFTFLYADFDNTDPDKAFHSVFVTRLLATTHLRSIRGHINVPALGTDALATSGGRGIIGLCGAAVFIYVLTLHFDLPRLVSSSSALFV